MSNLIKILVVEDDPGHREIHERRLSKFNPELHIVDNHISALEILKRHFFHVAVLDIRLRDWDPESEEGMMLADYIHSLNEGTGIIIVSNFGTIERTRDAFLKYKIVDFLEKTRYTGDQLEAAVKEAIATSEAVLKERRKEQLEITNLITNQTQFKEARELLSYEQQQSFNRILSNLVGPILPIAPITHPATHEAFVINSSERAFIFETSYWSRLAGQAIMVKIGPRNEINRQYETLINEGVSVERYTIQSITGIRYPGTSLSLHDFE